MPGGPYPSVWGGQGAATVRRQRGGSSEPNGVQGLVPCIAGTTHLPFPETPKERSC